jgi:hypothetical protein
MAAARHVSSEYVDTTWPGYRILPKPDMVAYVQSLHPPQRILKSASVGWKRQGVKCLPTVLDDLDVAIHEWAGE